MSDRTRSSRRKSRLVRKESLWSRLKSAPFDFLLSVSETIETIHWDSLTYTLAIPGGVAGNVILLLCRVLVDRSYTTSASQSSLSSWGSSGDDIFASSVRSSASSWIYAICSTLAYMLIIVSLGNALFCYSRTKKYSLVDRPLNKVPDTPSCRKVPYEDTTDQSESLSNVQASPIKKAFDSLLSFSSASSATPPTFNQDGEEIPEIWVLDVWDPPLFNLILMAIYSPLNVLLIWYGPLTFFIIVVLLPLQSYYLYTLTNLFLVQQKDRTILHSEVLSEYEQKVVRPVVSAARRDAAIGVDGEVQFYAPSLNHQFRLQNTHSSRSSTSTSSLASSPPFKLTHPAAESQLLGSPVFPSSLGAANSVRERSSLPPFKLTYNPAGYYTGTPNQSLSSSPVASASRRSSEYHNSPLSRKSESSLFRRLHKSARE